MRDSYAHVVGRVFTESRTPGGELVDVSLALLEAGLGIWASADRSD